MAGLLILFVAGLYIYVAYKIIFSLSKKWQRVFALVLLALVPTADEVYGRARLKKMCEAEGGFEVYRVKNDVEGFRVPRWAASEEWISKDGYRYVEWVDSDGTPMRISLGGDGVIHREKNVLLSGRYAYEDFDTEFGGGFSKYLQQVVDLETGEVLSRSVNISYAGGWVERLIGRLSGAGEGFSGACLLAGKRISLRKIVLSTLIPNK